ncbi:CPBP family intramembrane metalloprotease [archaeon]|nr:MAG: CPBP family intramembrane metalloprotease [archaeon]
MGATTHPPPAAPAGWLPDAACTPARPCHLARVRVRTLVRAVTRVQACCCTCLRLCTHAAAMSAATTAWRTNLAAGLEGVLCAALCLLLPSTLISPLTTPAPRISMDAVLVIRTLIALVLWSAVYGRRFFPGLTMLAATRRVLRNTLPALRARLTRASVIAAALYGSQIVAYAFLSDTALTSSHLWACVQREGVVWGPLSEEFIFRVALFYVVLQRSGGNVRLAVACSAFIFSAVHIANLLSAGGFWPVVCLQVALAALAGLFFALTFAATGSYVTVAALHGLNNLTAYAWMAVGPAASGLQPGTKALDAASAACTSVVTTSATFVLFLATSVVVLAYATWLQHRHLDDCIGRAGGFKLAHPIVYAAQFEAARDAAGAGSSPSAAHPHSE